MLAEGEESLVPDLECAQARVIEWASLDSAERLVCEIGQSRTTPERESCLDVARGVVCVTGRESTLRTRHKALEAVEVKLTLLKVRPVARAVALDPLRSQHAPKPVHIDLERRRGRRGWLVPPNRIHELIPGDDRPPRQQQLCKQGTLLRRTETYSPPIDEHLYRAEDSELVHPQHP